MSDIVYLNGKPMHFWQAWAIKVGIDADLQFHPHTPQERTVLIERIKSLKIETALDEC